MRTSLVLALVTLVACGGDGSSVSIDDAPQFFRDNYCKYLARCGLVESEAACESLNIGFDIHIDPNLRAAIEAGKVHYDGMLVERCYASFGNLACDATSENGRAFLGEACQGAVPGTVDDGGVCAINDECLSRTCNVPSCPDACCQGTCVGGALPPAPYQLGEACKSTDQCASGLYCDNASKVCTVLKVAGATCGSTAECAYGLGCAGPTTRVCETLPTLGEACPDHQCRDAGTYCSATSMTCARVGLPGDACATRADCSSFYICDATMHCALGPKNGEACSSTLRCSELGSFCETATMTCKPPQPDGATCSSNSNCESNYCNTTCMTKPVCI